MYRRLSSPHLVFVPRSLPSTKCRYFGRQPDNTSSDPSRQDFLCLLAKQFSSMVHSVASFLQPDDLGMVQRRGSVLPDRRSPQLSKQWESDTLHTPLYCYPRFSFKTWKICHCNLSQSTIITTASIFTHAIYQFFYDRLNPGTFCPD